ncbi:MAG TPA: glycosyl transferase family 2 [Elusimicrobia bacterium]|nr:MAG: hypothetical protein A2016_11445 [Elusimicrobia bacterium GWF2_62_30]HBA61035.1 glycosyl transferase family 2 [Elusimicrobiota bacterium]
MPGKTELSIVLPAYRERDNLALLLPEIKRVAAELTGAFEILVVDSFQPLDETAALCRGLGVRCVNRRGSDAYGDAVRTGISEAAGTYVVFMDADGSHAPAFLAELWQARESADVVVASRYVDGGRTDNSLALVLMSRTLNIIYSLVLGIPCNDISNSFKLYRGELLKGLALTTENFDIVEEIFYKLVKKVPGLRIKELPFRFEKRKHGETKRNLIVFMLSFLTTLIRLRFGRS